MDEHQPSKDQRELFLEALTAGNGSVPKSGTEGLLRGAHGMPRCLDSNAVML